MGSLSYNGNLYNDGQTVDIDPKSAAILAEIGVVELLEELPIEQPEEQPEELPEVIEAPEPEPLPEPEAVEPAETARINLNTATVEELDKYVDGVGLSTARAIVKLRDELGGFASVEQLKQVKGLNFDRVSQQVTLEG